MSIFFIKNEEYVVSSCNPAYFLCYVLLLGWACGGFTLSQQSYSLGRLCQYCLFDGFIGPF